MATSNEDVEAIRTWVEFAALKCSDEDLVARKERVVDLLARLSAELDEAYELAAGKINDKLWQDFKRVEADRDALAQALNAIVNAKSYVNAGGYAVTADEARDLAIERARALAAPAAPEKTWQGVPRGHDPRD